MALAWISPFLSDYRSAHRLHCAAHDRTHICPFVCDPPEGIAAFLAAVALPSMALPAPPLAGAVSAMTLQLMPAAFRSTSFGTINFNERNEKWDSICTQ
jgi:hypothetical protein